MNDGTGVRLIEAGNALHQRGLARAVMPRQGNALPVLNREGEIVEQYARAILHAQILNGQNHVPESIIGTGGAENVPRTFLRRLHRFSF